MRDSKADFQFLDFTRHSRPSEAQTASLEREPLQEPRQYEESLLMLGALLVSVGGIALAIAFGYALLRVLSQ